MVFVSGLVVTMFVLAIRQGIRRRRDLEAMAERLGLSFDPGRSRELARRFGHVPQMHRGSNRYASNILAGSFRGHGVKVFDFHYSVERGSGKNRHTSHEQMAIFSVELPGSFPRLTIAREDVFSKIAQSFGYDDIDFESHEFSRRFCVRSADKKFAYDFCHARTIEYLLAHDDLVIHLEGEHLLLIFPELLAVPEIPGYLEQLVTLRALMPEYLFAPA